VSLRDSLERYMAIGTQRDIAQEPLRSAILRLEREGNYLLQTRHHGWVSRRATDLNDAGNWPAYAMEVHLHYALENNGHTTSASVGIIPGENSDVDIVCAMQNGIKICAECVFCLEPQSFWQSKTEVASGLTISAAFYDGDGEVGILRRVQEKIRIKTIRNSGIPTKFPPIDTSIVNVIIVDATQGAGDLLDLWDEQLLSCGKQVVNSVAQRDLLGLFEPTNPYTPSFDEEYIRNRFLRERIHALLFLHDSSIWRGPLNPTYEGRVVYNPLLLHSLSDAQITAIADFGNGLSGLVQHWLVDQQWTTT